MSLPVRRTQTPGEPELTEIMAEAETKEFRLLLWYAGGHAAELHIRPITSSEEGDTPDWRYVDDYDAIWVFHGNPEMMWEAGSYEELKAGHLEPYVQSLAESLDDRDLEAKYGDGLPTMITTPA